MMLRRLLLVACSSIISVLSLASIQAIETCETSAAAAAASGDESYCASDTSTLAAVNGVHSIAIPTELIEMAGYYADTQTILEILDYRFEIMASEQMKENDDSDSNDSDSDDHLSNKVLPYKPLLLRGFDFGCGAADATITAVSAQSKASVNDVLAALAEEGLLQKVLTDAALVTGTTDEYVTCTNVSFVGWLGSSSTLTNYTNLLRLDDSSSTTTTTLVMPLILTEDDVAVLDIVTTDGITQVPLITGTALLLDNAKLLSYQAVASGLSDDPNLVLVMTLTPTTTTTTAQPPLPLPISPYSLDQDFRANPLAPLQIEPIRWARSGVIPTAGGAFRIRLPDTVSSGLLQYCQDELGVVDLLRTLLYDEPMEMAWINQKVTLGNNASNSKSTTTTTAKGVDWYVERPSEYDRFDMLFMVPANEMAHTDFLKAASAAGLDAVIDAVGRRFGWEGAVCTHISLLALSAANQHAVSHADFYETGGKAFNVLIPMILVDGSEPELLLDGDDQIRGQWQYQPNEAIMVGDHAMHATKSIHYRDLPGKQFRFFCGIYLGDINKENVEMAMPVYYKDGYPHHDSALTLSNAGNHWNPNDATKKLPTW